jgi:hypothetical protein
VRRALLPPPGQCIGGTRNQDLLIVHGIAIQSYGLVRMIRSIVKDLGLALTNGPSEQGLRARTGVEVLIKHEKPHCDRRFSSARLP